jgi:dihydroorotate dehydrogenase
VSWIYRRVIRPALFAQDSEKIHDRTLRALGCASRRRLLTSIVNTIYGAPELPVEVFGLKFPNPVGLAAGMDKLAQAVPVWPALGYGFSELGGVTWHPQPGNPRPRIARAIKDEAVVNSMGFNNPGAEAIAAALARWKEKGLWPAHPVGINLGKSKITAIADAAGDYANSFQLLRSHADFFVVNVSSPNTPNLRQLQDKSALDEILAALQEIQNPRASSDVATSPPHRPILVKVAPDLSFDALDEILELVGSRQIAGIVATNTTITRPDTTDPRLKQVYAAPGGLSGRPLRARSTEVVRHLYQQTRGTLPIIGVGGIFTAADAWEKITAGASLIQIYTGMIYEGPSIAKTIVRGLTQRLAENSFPTWTQAVGSGKRAQYPTQKAGDEVRRL